MRFAKLFSVLVIAATTLAGTVHAESAESIEELSRQVRDSENAFAATMAQRDLKAFESFIAEDAVFFGKAAMRGKDAVVAGWKGLYQGEKAPFSWQSETVEVLATGTLAHSSGPVLDAHGHRVATFNSIWRREPDGKWRVVFDKGCDACNCADAK
jgi:ketosteroid isomerase-like protein